MRDEEVFTARRDKVAVQHLERRVNAGSEYRKAVTDVKEIEAFINDRRRFHLPERPGLACALAMAQFRAAFLKPFGETT